MASNQTSSYGLSQWEATDQVKRTDFNADNAKIDAALEELVSGKATTTALNSALSRITALESGKASQTDVAVLEDTVQQLTLDLTKIVVGSYTGNGTSPRTISLGAKPKAGCGGRRAALLLSHGLPVPGWFGGGRPRRPGLGGGHAGENRLKRISGVQSGVRPHQLPRLPVPLCGFPVRKETKEPPDLAVRGFTFQAERADVLMILIRLPLGQQREQCSNHPECRSYPRQTESHR